MSDVSIVPVDERDSGWERRDPRFRVYLHGSGENTTQGWTATYDVTGANVLQVVEWAQRQAGELLTYAVALVLDDAEEERRDPGHGRGLVWLIGMDGNDIALGTEEAAAQAGMLARRGTTVVIPPEDRMPHGVPDPYNDGTKER